MTPPSGSELTSLGPVATVDRLVDLLRRERAAIAALDKDELEALADGGHDLLRSLKESLLRGGRPTGVELERFSDAVRRLVAEAEVNALLLRDANHLLAQMLGPPQTPGTYNARGELSKQVQRVAGKLI